MRFRISCGFSRGCSACHDRNFGQGDAGRLSTVEPTLLEKSPKMARQQTGYNAQVKATQEIATSDVLWSDLDSL